MCISGCGRVRLEVLIIMCFGGVFCVRSIFMVGRKLLVIV